MTDVVVVTGGTRGREVETSTAELGRHIRTNPRPIARYCFNDIAAASEDVATIVESIALADRLFTRRRSQGWSRTLTVRIPVFEVETFKSPLVSESLTEAVGFLTGDEWAFEFVARTDAPARERYLPLVDEAPKHVMAFSEGLDSFAQARLIDADHGAGSLLRVRAGKVRKGDSRIGIPILEIPRGFRAGHPRERTYRTRPLVYFSFAAIVAATAKADSVVIGENGQGAIGPSFARFSNEWPFRSAHPGFVVRLSLFLSRALGTEIRIDQPQVWRTKGQVISELRDRDLLLGWQETHSCSVRPLQRKGRRACGYCGGCLLRQTALRAAGIEFDTDSTYDIESSDLFTVSNTAEREAMAMSQREIFVRAALSMATLAEVGLQPDAPQLVAREARDIPGLTPDVAMARLGALIVQHRKEWLNLLGSLPHGAWLKDQFAPA